jgi:superfamily II DNA or RNA helicase
MAGNIAKIGEFRVQPGVSRKTRHRLRQQQSFSFPDRYFAGFVTGRHTLGISSAFLTSKGVHPTFLLGGEVDVSGQRHNVLIASHSRSIPLQMDVLFQELKVGGQRYENLVVPSKSVTVENEKCLIYRDMVQEQREIGREQELELPFGVNLRQYQKQFVEVVLNAMSKGKDRGYIVAPWQVGKTMCLVPLVTEVQKLHPGKKVLIVSPSKIITASIVEDFEANFGGRVSRVDNHHKDFGGDVVIASAYTLRKSKHLRKIDPSEYCLAVVDEANFSVASSWVRILTRLGFLDGGKIKKVEGRFLLGLTATPERGDQRHIAQVFGWKSILSMKSVAWFVRNGYLHDVEGIKVDLIPPESIETVENGEILVTTNNFEQYSQSVIDCYERLLSGKKTLIYVARIEHAKILEEAFDKIYGVGYAKALHSQMTDHEVDGVVEAYVAGNVRVMISINKLAYGFRAIGTEGVIHTYMTNSWSRYAQRTGRALAVENGETQRLIRVVDVGWRGQRLYTSMNVPRLFGFAEYPPAGKLRPLEEHAKHTKQKLKRGTTRVPADLRMQRLRHIRAKIEHRARLALVLRDMLEEGFDYDVLEMSSVMLLRPDKLNNLLAGELPHKRSQVIRMAETLGLEPAVLLDAWVEDKMEVMSLLHPFPQEMGGQERYIVELVRRMVLTAHEGSVNSLVKKDIGIYGLILGILKGKGLPTTPGQYQKIEDLFLRLAPQLLDEFQAAFKDYARSQAESELLAMWQGEFKRNGEISYRVRQFPLQKLHENIFDALDFAEPVPDIENMVITEQTPHDVSVFRRLSGELRNILKTLVPREEYVIRKRFGIEEKEMSYREICGYLDVGYERIRQVELKALRKLRHPSRTKNLRPYENFVRKPGLVDEEE